MTRRNIHILIVAAGVLVVVGAAFFLLRRPADLAPGPVTILSARGEASLYHPATAIWTKAAPKTAVTAGDIASTGTGGTLDLGEEKLYALRLGGETALSVRPAAGEGPATERVFYLQEGRAAAVTYADFTGMSLVIETSRTRVTARGTAFSVSAGPGDTTAVEVESGEVSIALAGGGEIPSPVVVTAGLAWNWSGAGTPLSPLPLSPAPAQALREEIADIGRGIWELRQASPDEGKEKPVSLILSDSPRRVDELLMPCGLYVSESAPLDIYNLLLKASETARDGDYEGSVKMLEQALKKFPDRRAALPLKLLIGAQYWALLDRPGEAIAIFEEVAREGDDESSALAQAAIGVIHDKLSRRAFADVIKRFKDSPEAQRAREK
jgi:hypothetical protein